MDLFHPTVFCRPKTISNVAIIKTKSATVALFLLYSSSLFLCSPSLVWFWSWSSPKTLPFDAFSLIWLQISLGWFSKNRLRYKLDVDVRCEKQAINCYCYYYYIIIMTVVAAVQHCGVGKCRQFREMSLTIANTLIV